MSEFRPSEVRPLEIILALIGRSSFDFDRAEAAPTPGVSERAVWTDRVPLVRRSKALRSNPPLYP